MKKNNIYLKGPIFIFHHVWPCDSSTIINKINKRLKYTCRQTSEWIKWDKITYFTIYGIRCTMMLWNLTNTTFERLNSEQMREQIFYMIWLKEGCLSLLQWTYIWEFAHGYDVVCWLMTFIYFLSLDSNRYIPLCSLAIKIIFHVARFWLLETEMIKCNWYDWYQ